MTRVRVNFIGLFLILMFDISAGLKYRRADDPLTSKEAAKEASKESSKETSKEITKELLKGEENISGPKHYKMCIGCYVKENILSPKVQLAAEVALQKYIETSTVKEFAMNKMIGANRYNYVGFQTHKLKFYIRATSNCMSITYFCPPPTKCKADVNEKDNKFNVVSVECRPRLAETPDPPGWEW